MHKGVPPARLTLTHATYAVRFPSPQRTDLHSFASRMHKKKQKVRNNKCGAAELVQCCSLCKLTEV